MDESIQGILIFTAIIVVSSLLWHSILKKFFAAVVGSVVTTVVAFQIVNYIHIGYLDPFFIIAIGVSAIIATFISVAIGTLYNAARKRRIKNGIKAYKIK